MKNILFALGFSSLMILACSSSTENSTSNSASIDETPEKGTQKPDEQEEKKIHWISFEEAQEKMKTEPRKIIVDVYTEWCGPCKMMMKNTFTNPVIIDYINTNYYAVKFNAESGDTVVFKGKTFTNPNFDASKRGRNSTHELTYAIANINGGIAYPTTIYIDEDLNLLTGIQGYLDPARIEPILAYFHQDKYKDIKYNEFERVFESKL